MSFCESTIRKCSAVSQFHQFLSLLYQSAFGNFIPSRETGQVGLHVLRATAENDASDRTADKRIRRSNLVRTGEAGLV